MSKEDSCHTSMSFCGLYRTGRHRVQGHAGITSGKLRQGLLDEEGGEYQYKYKDLTA